MSLNIGVIGVGGVGGYFGGKLAQAVASDKELRVYFIARGQHLREIQKQGLTLDTDEGVLVCRPALATADFEELPQLDICLVCVKSYDLDGVLPYLAKKVFSSTLLLPLLNGVDIYDRIRTHIKTGIVLQSCVYVGTHIEHPGKVIQRGGSCTVILGPDPEQKTDAELLLGLFRATGIRYQWLADPYPAIWSKFIFIAAFGLVTAESSKTIGEVLLSRELSSRVKGIMEEIAGIARKQGVMLQSALVEDAFNKGKGFPFDARTSFQRDYARKDKPDERDLFGGTIIRLGETTGSAVPITREVYASLLNKQPPVKPVVLPAP